MPKIQPEAHFSSVLGNIFRNKDNSRPEPPTITYEEKEYIYLAEGSVYDVFYNEETKTVLKLPQFTTVNEQQTMNERSKSNWDAGKRDGVKKAEIVTATYNPMTKDKKEYMQGRESKTVSVLKVPYFNPRAHDVAFQEEEVDYVRIQSAINKESMRVFLTAGIIIPGNLTNFVYDEKTNKAHCLDYDGYRAANRRKYNRYDMNDRFTDRTRIGAFLKYFSANNIIRIHSKDQGAIDMEKSIEQIFATPSIDRIFGTHSLEYAANDIYGAVYSEYPNQLCDVQSKIRKYVNFRLGPNISLQDVMTKDVMTKKGDSDDFGLAQVWRGSFRREGKISLLKDLLTALSKCGDDDDIDKLKTLLEKIQTAQKTNLESEQMHGRVKGFGRHPGGKLGKLLDQCEEHVNKIIKGLENKNTPTLTA